MEVILTKDKIERVRKMLSSVNEEDRVVAFETMEQLNFKENVAHILIAIKESGYTNINTRYYTEHFPSFVKHVGEIHSNALTYEKILEITHKTNPDRIDVVKEYIEERILHHLENVQIDFIEDIKITLDGRFSG